MNNCLYCNKEVKNKVCNASCQMKYEYKIGIRSKSSIALKAQQAKRDKTLENFNNGTMKSYIGKRGYRILYTPDGKVPEHEFIWRNESEWHFIPNGFVVHHINGNKLDNRIENLACIPKDIHLKGHYMQRKINALGRFE